MSEFVSGCSNLTALPANFSFSSTVTVITRAFLNCSNLVTLPENFTIPASVTNAAFTFKGCSKLEGSITILGNPITYSEMFNGTSTSGSGLTVYYTNACTNINNIMATKSSNSKITFINLDDVSSSD